MHTASHVRGEYSFSGKEPVILALPNGSDPDDEALMEMARERLAFRGMSIVEDVSEAKRILTFNVTRHVEIETSVSLMRAEASRSGLDIGDDKLKWREVASNTAIDTAKTIVSVEMLDIARAVSQEDPVIWEARIAVNDEHYEEYPEAVLDNLLEAYGKNVVREGRFKPPFQRKDKTSPD
ncbi:MAG: hypothetical protein RBT76_04495 [candidate division Zixibacteria bacterium]|jgi:hypothetical protein|nr:hypothetical protein [candidate division Zixibacteria bacterium]